MRHFLSEEHKRPDKTLSDYSPRSSLKIFFSNRQLLNFPKFQFMFQISSFSFFLFFVCLLFNVVVP